MGIGIALGGVAQGLESAEKARIDREALKQRGMAIAADTKLRQEALAIQSKQEDRLANQDLLSNADGLIGANLKVVGEVIKGAKEANHTPEQIASTVEDLLQEVDRLAMSVGRDPQIYRKQVQSMLTQPTAVEAGKAAGTAAKAQSEASGKDIDETIKLKIARGEPLTAGETQLYNDSLKKGSSELAEIFKHVFGPGGEPGAAETSPTTLPAPAPAAAQAAPAGIPALPANLIGKGAKWSPSKQRWFTPDGASFNQQGVPG